MTDPGTRLRDLERISPPDLWQDIVQRVPGSAPPAPSRRVAAVAVALVAVVVGVVIPLSFLGDGQRPVEPGVGPSISPSTETPVYEPMVFVPETRTEGSSEIMPVVFPDGSAAELVYPPELRLAEMGLQPDVALTHERDTGPRYAVWFVHTPNTFETPEECQFSEDGWNDTYRPRAGQTVLAQGDATGYCLTFHPPWVGGRRSSWALIVIGVPTVEPEALARALHLRIDNGFPFLSASKPVALAVEYGEARGPQLTIGDPAPDPDALGAGNQIELAAPAESCPHDAQEPRPTYAAFCIGEGPMQIFVSVTGDAQFVATVRDGLTARGVVST